MIRQSYCTVDQVIRAMEGHGLATDEMLDLIQHSSRFIQGRSVLRTNLVPILEAREFDGTGRADQRITPFTSLTSLVLDGTTLTEGDEFHQIGSHIRTPHWDNGPYSKVRKESGVWPEDNGNLVITALWGLYYEALEIIASTTLAAADTAELLVVDGTTLSPGMHLVMEDEQLWVKDIKDATASGETLGAALSKAADTLTVSDASAFQVGEVIQIDLEDMKITKRNLVANSLAVIRGWNKTYKESHLNAAPVNVYRTYGLDRGVNGTTAAIHTTKPISQLLIPDDIQYLAIELTVLAWQRGKIKFASKEAKADSFFYFDEFPKKSIKMITRNYIISSFGS